MRTKDSIIEEIIQFFKDNKSVFNTAIEELDDCNENGYLGDTRCRSMVELNDRCYGSLVSCDSPDYFNQLDESAVESLCENRRHIPTIRKNADLEQLFNELEAFD